MNANRNQHIEIRRGKKLKLDHIVQEGNSPAYTKKWRNKPERAKKSYPWDGMRTYAFQKRGAEA